MDTDEACLAELARVTQSINTNFALGGSVEIIHGTSNDDTSDQAASVIQKSKAGPVILRWDGRSGVQKIDFSAPTMELATALEALVHDCQPATFGHQGRDVYDETYRQAGKMDESAFCTNFHPADCGITDAVAQALLPMIGNGQAGLRGVHAELYKLSESSFAPSSR